MSSSVDSLSPSDDGPAAATEPRPAEGLGPVYLHIGLMKSGTTYLQRMLNRNRARLAEQGVTFTGRHWSLQVVAVEELLDIRPEGKPRAPGAWDRLVTEVGRHPGPNLISMEFLAAAEADEARRAVESFPGRRVRVVITARDLGRTLPALWQERVRNGGTIEYDTYIRDALDPLRLMRRLRMRRHPLYAQDLERILGVWVPLVGVHEVVVVTVPPAGAPPDLLWRRFCQAIEIDPEGFSFPGPSNEALGAVSVELLRRLNQRLGGRKSARPARRYVKYELGRRVLPTRRSVEPTLVLPAGRWQGVAERAAAWVKVVEDAGVTVVGDLTDLLVDASLASTQRSDPIVDEPSAITDSDLLDAAMDALVTRVRGKDSS